MSNGDYPVNTPGTDSGEGAEGHLSKEEVDRRMNKLWSDKINTSLLTAVDASLCATNTFLDVLIDRVDDDVNEVLPVLFEALVARSKTEPPHPEAIAHTLAGAARLMENIAVAANEAAQDEEQNDQETE
jgi:hypothetical protein